MKVGIMARSLRRPVTGIGRYTRCLAGSVARRLAPEPVTLFLTRDEAANGLPGEKVVCPLPTPHESLRALWEHTFVPLAVSRQRIDVYHSPNYTLPLSLPCPGVVTVHDLAFLDSRLHKTRVSVYLRLLTGASLRRARRVIAVSEFTRRRLLTRYPYLEGRVKVVYPGLDPQFAARLNGGGGAGPQMHPRPYVFFAGSVEPRKNLRRLVRAFEQAMNETGLPHDLVLAGPLGWRYEASLRAIATSPLRDRIHRPGFVAEEDLPAWYAGADLVVYPSLEEGFGFPVLEAMAAGTPVVSSSVSSIPEVAGDAAELVSPKDTGAIARAMARILTDRQLAASMRERGLARAATFTWEDASEATVSVYREAAERQ